MPDRIEKPKSRSRINASSLAARIERSGFLMARPCSRCVASSKKCWVSSESNKCSACSQHGGSCDVFGPSDREYQRLIDEEDKLEFEEERTREALRAATSKLDRLQRQRKLLRTRGIEMIRRGIEGAEAMEEYERLEKEKKKIAEEQSRVSTALATPEFDWSSLDSSWEVDPALLALAGQDAGGGIVQQSPAHSPGVS